MKQFQKYLLYKGGIYRVKGQTVTDLEDGYVYDTKPLFIQVSNTEINTVKDIIAKNQTLKETIKELCKHNIYTYISELDAGDLLYTGILQKLSLLNSTHHKHICRLLSLLGIKRDSQITSYVNGFEVIMVCDYYLIYLHNNKYQPIFFDEITGIQIINNKSVKVTHKENTYTLTTTQQNLTQIKALGV